MESFIFRNLEAELARAGISKSTLARVLSVSVSTLYAKLRGEREFKLEEMERIRSYLERETGSELTIDYIFDKTVKKVSSF